VGWCPRRGRCSATGFVLNSAVEASAPRSCERKRADPAATAEFMGAAAARNPVRSGNHRTNHKLAMPMAIVSPSTNATCRRRLGEPSESAKQPFKTELPIAARMTDRVASNGGTLESLRLFAIIREIASMSVRPEMKLRGNKPPCTSKCVATFTKNATAA